MVVRCRVQGLVLLCLVTALIGCAADGLNSVQVTPKIQSLAVGQTAQFTAVGSYGNSKSLSSQNITSSVTWASSAPSIATVSASGVATTVGAGTTTITASAQGWSGHVSDSAVLTVTAQAQAEAEAPAGGLSLRWRSFQPRKRSHRPIKPPNSSPSERPHRELR